MEENDNIPEIADWILQYLKVHPDAPLPEELSHFAAASEENAELLSRLSNMEILSKLLQERKTAAESKLQNWKKIQAAMDEQDAGRNNTAVVRPIFQRRWWLAAAVVLLMSIGAYLWISSDNIEKPSGEKIAGKGISPGKDGAILTLSDGSQIILDSLGNGTIANQSGSRISLADGRVSYDPISDTTTAILYNSMTTPKGRQFQLSLPDGSRVWLNAASSIRYPTKFRGNERKVELTGEAYFEVANNNTMPFIVAANGQAEVQVLGTSFNVNAYDDESTINTTLIEGAVKVKAAEQPAVLLQPGQQAQLPVVNNTISEKIKLIRNADVDQVIAWKNGFFNFEGQSLRVVMRQLGRWYDIDVVYKENVQDVIFRGKIFRNLKLGDVLYILQKMGVKFEMQGRRLTVTD